MSKEKKICPTCGSERILHIKEGLNKCMICGQYMDDDGLVSKLTVASSASQVKELASTPLEEVEEISEAQWKFINAVCNRLTYAPYMRKHYREMIVKVFKGEITMDECIDRLCVETGQKEDDLKSIMNEEFQRVPEAQREAGKKSLF